MEKDVAIKVTLRDLVNHIQTYCDVNFFFLLCNRVGKDKRDVVSVQDLHADYSTRHSAVTQFTARPALFFYPSYHVNPCQPKCAYEVQ